MAYWSEYKNKALSSSKSVIPVWKMELKFGLSSFVMFASYKKDSLGKGYYAEITLQGNYKPGSSSNTGGIGFIVFVMRCDTKEQAYKVLMNYKKKLKFSQKEFKIKTKEK